MVSEQLPSTGCPWACHFPDTSPATGTDQTPPVWRSARVSGNSGVGPPDVGVQLPGLPRPSMMPLSAGGAQRRGVVGCPGGHERRFQSSEASPLPGHTVPSPASSTGAHRHRRGSSDAPRLERGAGGPWADPQKVRVRGIFEVPGPTLTVQQEAAPPEGLLGRV